jgi:hypothetical protein
VTPAVPGARPGRPASVRSVHHPHARDHITVRLYHMAEPWAGWVALLVLAAGLRMFFPGWVLAFITAALGMVLAALDHHLRSHRTKLVGRLIGPVTTAACTGWLAAVIYAGWSRPLLEAWLAGGIAACIAWDIWIVAGDHHDLARAFLPAAEASGLAGSRLTGIRRRQAHVSTAARMQLPRGTLKTSDVAAQLENLEGALAYPPGSWSITGDRADAGAANVLITNPELLDVPGGIPWPGPSAPGQSVAVPFREGVWADGEPFLYDLLPLHHMKEMGATNAGKTRSWYSHFAEGITRHDFACLACDITKGEQFLGPLRPALHWLVTDPEEVLDFHAAIHRVIRARCDFLGRNHLVEWRPGCGLTYLAVRREETPDCFGLLKDARGAHFREHVSDIRAARSAGVAWWDSYQRADHTQLPTIVRGQMGHLCFGVMERKDAEFGLSEVQRERGARPEIWQVAVPGKALIDTLTIPEERKTLPLRYFSWGPDSSRIAAYASEWPADRRPLDDVTGEALEARPGRPASTAFPAPRSANGHNGNGSSGHQNGNGNGSSGHQNGSPGTPPPGARLMPDYSGRISPEEALAKIRVQLAAWKGSGTRFTLRELALAVGEEVVCLRSCGNPYCAGRSRAWLYNQVDALIMTKELSSLGGRPARYEVTGVPEGEPA